MTGARLFILINNRFFRIYYGREGEGGEGRATVAQLTEPTPNWLVFTILSLYLPFN